ncbi:NAD(P)-dependent oxidoreductase [Rhizosphaericola mali]|uniref:NAD(P)H-binding protein n=1 Tax=Rhizosphaericola mali TaxID=2545455 RepID=A0A5P2G4Q1_9BACT|nr:NAD(P)H-binding protein [Rhizosphaericola mali]QES89668.1 NAD(P)H-binding protein [Rhizosphaericola mali]
MHITIIGASNGVGYQSVLQALKKGYRVTALSSRLDTLPDDENLIKITGSATNPDDVERAILNTDAVLITIGTKQKKNSTLFSDMAKAVVKAAERVNYISPVIFISGFGVGEGYRYASIFIKLVISLFLKDQYRDKKLMEDIFEQSYLQWVMLQPGILSDAPLTSNYKVYSSFEKRMKVGKISRMDVADFMLKEASAPRYLKKRVIVTY